MIESIPRKKTIKEVLFPPESPEDYVRSLSGGISISGDKLKEFNKPCIRCTSQEKCNRRNRRNCEAWNTWRRR